MLAIGHGAEFDGAIDEVVCLRVDRDLFRHLARRVFEFGIVVAGFPEPAIVEESSGNLGQVVGVPGRQAQAQRQAFAVIERDLGTDDGRFSLANVGRRPGRDAATTASMCLQVPSVFDL